MISNYYLVCSFVEILSIEGQPKAHSDTGSKFDIISEDSNAPVIQLGLIHKLSRAGLNRCRLSE